MVAKVEGQNTTSADIMTADRQTGISVMTASGPTSCVQVREGPLSFVTVESHQSLAPRAQTERENILAADLQKEDAGVSLLISEDETSKP
jgi:hypothetical protein